MTYIIAAGVFAPLTCAAFVLWLGSLNDPRWRPRK